MSRRLVDSIYQSHQLLVGGPLRQWIVFGYTDSMETELFLLGELLIGDLLAALSTILLL